MTQSYAKRRITITGVTIVDTDDGTLRREMTVRIEAGRIVSVERSDARDDPEAVSIDGRGRYLIPGYLDMHAHVLDAPSSQAYRDLMLANGITGFRQMSGSTQLLDERRRSRSEAHAGPRVLAMPGEILTNLNASSPEAAVAEVRRQHAAGADFIKVLEVSPPAFFAALAEARTLGLPFAGHLPATVDAFEASNAGMRSIEHLGPRDSILAGCSCAGHAAATEPPAAQAINPPPLPPGVDPAAFFARMIANPLLFTHPAEFERYRRVIDAYDDAACSELAELFARNQTWQVPTLVRLRTMAYADAALYREDPNLRFVPRSTRALWDELAQQFALRLSDTMKQAIRSLYALQERLVARFVRAGVPMLAGSDLGGQWVIPGAGLHQEFDLLARAGLDALAILQMTTRDGARFLGLERDLGSVAVGKYADLVFLDDDPVRSVAALHKISGVLHAEGYYAREDLESIKEATALALGSEG